MEQQSTKLQNFIDTTIATVTKEKQAVCDINTILALHLILFVSYVQGNGVAYSNTILYRNLDKGNKADTQIIHVQCNHNVFPSVDDDFLQGFSIFPISP